MGAVFKLEPAREAESAALNVTASVRGFVWRERLDRAGAGTALAISQRYALPELLGRVLAARGVGLDDVPVALDPTVKALMPDPSTLRDMDKAAARIADAVGAARERRHLRRLRRGRRLLLARCWRASWPRTGCARASTSPTA